MDLLLVIDENKSQYVYIKDFHRLMLHETKNTFAKVQCLISKNIFNNPKKDCLSINGTTEFKNYLKQIPIQVKIYADFESNSKSVESHKCSHSKQYQDHDPFSSAYQLVCINDEFSKLIVVKMLHINLLKQFLKSMHTVKK